MKLKHLTNIQGACFKPSNESSSVIFASWSKLYRNLKGFPFIPVIPENEKAHLHKFLVDKFKSELSKYRFDHIDLGTVTPVDLALLKEKVLIERVVNASLCTNTSLLLSTSENKSIQINTNEQICIQHAQHGLACLKMWEYSNHMDDEISQIVQYAYDKKFGYLCSDIKLTGNALKFEVLLHLPAFVFTGKIHQKIQEISKGQFRLKSFFANQQFPIGNLFVLSNKNCISFSEEELANEIETLSLSLAIEEKNLREVILKNSEHDLIDKVQRAFGLLSHTKQISMQEAFTYLSIIKLGIDLEQFPFLNNQIWFRLFVICQNAHIQESCDKEMETKEIEQTRATILSQKLKSIES